MKSHRLILLTIITTMLLLPASACKDAETIQIDASVDSYVGRTCDPSTSPTCCQTDITPCGTTCGCWKNYDAYKFVISDDSNGIRLKKDWKAGTYVAWKESAYAGYEGWQLIGTNNSNLPEKINPQAHKTQTSGCPDDHALCANKYKLDKKAKLHPGSRARIRPTNCPEQHSSGLSVVPISIGGELLCAEVAIEGHIRSKGLVGRSTLGENQAMLFAFETPHEFNVHMSGVKFDLSIAFLNENKQVQKLADMRKGDIVDTGSPECTQYAIEVNNGWYEAHGVKPDEAVEFELPQGFQQHLDKFTNPACTPKSP